MPHAGSLATQVPSGGASEKRGDVVRVLGGERPPTAMQHDHYAEVAAGLCHLHLQEARLEAEADGLLHCCAVGRDGLLRLLEILR
eukprot:5066397-Lingulodinium_polyedra.AAC.1